MATLTRGATYSTTETITNTKLHNLVDLGSVSQIVDADISSSANIADTKLADITTGGKVRGTSLLNLQSLVSSAGQIPLANIPFLGSSLISLVSIPNASLLPINLASWVDGSSLKNLASTPVDQQIRYNLLVQSLASGGLSTYNGVNNFVGKNLSEMITQPALTLKSTTSVSSGTTSGSISLTAGKSYKIIIKGSFSTDNQALNVYFNADTGANYQRATSTGQSSLNVFNSSSVNNSALGGFNITINLNYEQSDNTIVTGDVTGHAYVATTSTFVDVGYRYDGASNVTAFNFEVGAGNITATVWVYEYSGT